MNRLLFAVWLMILNSTVVVAEAEQPNTEFGVAQKDIWRSTENDGLNCVYMYSKLHGSNVSYESLRNRLNRNENVSLLDLKNAVEHIGLSVDVTKPRLDQMGNTERKQLPAIVLLDNLRGGQKSGFSLVIDVQEDKVVCISGGTAIWRTFPKDDFLRRWSGYALTPALVSNAALTRPSLSHVIASGMILVIYGGIRWRRKISEKSYSGARLAERGKKQ